MTRLTVRFLGFVLSALAGAVLVALTSVTTPAFAYGDDGTALIMGGTGYGHNSPEYVADVYDLYIQPKYPGYTPEGLDTLEQYWPFTGLTSKTFGESVMHDAGVLDAAIREQNAAGHDVVSLGYSQSASVTTLEMQNLDALPVAERPTPEQLAFVLLADANNPDGGMFERFPGLYIPILDLSFSGATPPDTPYPTDIYTIQYDPVADFPQYPLNPLSDLNALLGYFYLHSTYSYLTPDEVSAAVQLPTSPDYYAAGGVTDYYMILTQNLPLLDPLRQIPLVGNPLADLLQPDLRVLVDLGYGDGYANVATPAGLFPLVNPITVAGELATGAQQGLVAALVDIGLLPSSDLPDSYPYLPAAETPGEILNPGLMANDPLGLADGALATLLSDMPGVPGLFAPDWIASALGLLG